MVLGLLFGKMVKAHLFTPVVVASRFILGGFIILWAGRRSLAATRIPDSGRVTLRNTPSLAWCSAGR